MNTEQLTVLVNGLIALCQNHDLLSTTSDDLLDELQAIVSDEMYISKMELQELL